MDNIDYMATMCAGASAPRKKIIVLVISMFRLAPTFALAGGALMPGQILPDCIDLKGYTPFRRLVFLRKSPASGIIILGCSDGFGRLSVSALSFVDFVTLPRGLVPAKFYFYYDMSNFN